LANLHRALAPHRDAALIESAQRPALDLQQRITDWLDLEDRGTAPTASDRLRNQIASMRPIDTEPQLVHNDYRAGNILTVDSDVTAVLDFDEIAWDYCVGDLARASVYLSTLFTTWAPTPADVRQVFFEGYQSVRPLTSLEHEWLPNLVLWYGIGAIPSGHDPAGWADAL
jgi:Ser/Thr protein kinase RdoA (MazF antagonist)